MNWPGDFINKIICGDCLGVMKEMPDKSVDLVLTDPPYGININKSSRLSISRGFGHETWDREQPSKEYFNEIFRVSSSQVIWGGNYFNLSATRCFLIWDKQNDERDFADCELAWTSFDSVARIFRKRPQNMDGGKVHPTQKPLALFTWILNKYSNESDLIFDPFLGSGTTVEACKLLHRNFIGIEINPDYCKIAEERLAQGVL